MRVHYTPSDLVAFEDRVAQTFAAGKIRAPVHLAGGNEGQLIEVFQEYVDEQDWVLCSWRAHYHCLLKGVPQRELYSAILAGKSISLCFPEHRILSSGIVGGTAPIAVGLAMAIKRKQKSVVEQSIADKLITFGKLQDSLRKVVCFVGDMTAEGGAFYEAVKYAVNFNLPVLFVVEDNGFSVSTETSKAWGGVDMFDRGRVYDKVLCYQYRLTRPHVGIGKHVAF